ncbi:unnamed protein product [Cyprideis torosa]|uniref:Uncharacterized protein n=1 Tax=Cyprideis torosa TaxID=163714 RepID=A0A7R8WBD9_9CRUS|nr:unnamed protein product [Cyprideis torosa]CAG0886815.1 unnamed protein product [Cyprideis torosa]
MVNVRSPSSLSMVGCGGGNPMVSSSPRSPGEHAVRLLHSLSFPSMANVNYFNGSGDSHSPAEMNVKLKNLPDQYEGVSTHTERGIHFLDKLGSFLRDRAVVEQEYAGKLNAMVVVLELGESQIRGQIPKNPKLFVVWDSASAKGFESCACLPPAVTGPPLELMEDDTGSSLFRWVWPIAPFPCAETRLLR